MKSTLSKNFIPIIILFVSLTAIIFLLHSLLADYGFDVNFLLIANLLLFVLSLVAFMIQSKGVRSPDPQKFVRGVYASMMIKMFICMIAILIYIVLNKKNINKPALFTSMGIYIFYTVIEVSGLMKAARKNTNA